LDLRPFWRAVFDPWVCVARDAELALTAWLRGRTTGRHEGFAVYRA
jgi:hypothetical protein